MKLHIDSSLFTRVVQVQRSLATFEVFAAAYFFSFFQRVSLAVVASNVARDLAVGAVGLSLMSSAYFVTYALVQPVVGMLSDRAGPRITTSALLLVGATGSVLFAMADGLPMALLARVLVGAGAAGAFVPGMKAISTQYAPSEFARINGFFLSIGNLGAVFAAVPLAYLASGIGWRNSFAVVGGISFALAWVCWLVLEDQALPSQDSPTGTKQGAARRHKGMGVAWEVVKTGQFWLLSIFLFCKYGGQATFQALWGVSYITDVYNLSQENAASVVMTFTVGYMVGAPLLGYVSDRLFRRRKGVLLGAAAVFAITWLPIVLSPGKVPPVVLCAILFIMGLAASSANLALVMVKESFTSSISGTAVGCANVANMLGAAIVPGIAGWLISHVGVNRTAPDVMYRYAFLPCLMFALIGFVAIVFAKDRAATAEVGEAADAT